ncbi:MAG TPA: hypothetical protein VGD55_04860 [Acidothermaceae bacterium]
MVAAVAGALAVLFVAARDLTHGAHLGAFALASSVFVHPGASADLPVHTGTNGYDGQFYYRLALDPLTHRATAFHITLDNPPYRQQRIGLPATAWFVREVFRAPTSLTLVLVNVLALVAVGWAAAVWARQYGRSTWWGLALAASPALVMALARDLTEPLATAALVIGLLAWTRRKWWLASMAFTAAVLCRETVLIVLLGMGVWCLVRVLRGGGLIRRRTGVAQVVALCVPAAVEVSWQFHVREVWGGKLPTLSGSNQVGFSLLRPARSFFYNASGIGFSHQGILDGIWLLERFLLATFLVAVLSGLLRSAAPPELRLGWIFAAVLALTVAWNQDVEFVRAANEAIIVGQLLLLARGDRVARAAVTGVFGWSALVAVVYAAAL